MGLYENRVPYFIPWLLMIENGEPNPTSGQACIIPVEYNSTTYSINVNHIP